MKLLIGVGGWVGIGVAVVLVLIIIIWAISTYNKLVGIGTHCDESLSTIDIYLKKRYDLIPNIVETVKGYAKHESDVFIKVTEARAKLGAATTAEEKIAADKEFTQAIRNFNAVVENYPELKANINFMDLQKQLKAIEAELAQARNYYNANVREVNKKIRSFPSLIIAKMMKLKTRQYFTVDAPEERQNVKVQF